MPTLTTPDTTPETHSNGNGHKNGEASELTTADRLVVDAIVERVKTDPQILKLLPEDPVLMTEVVRRVMHPFDRNAYPHVRPFLGNNEIRERLGSHAGLTPEEQAIWRGAYAPPKSVKVKIDTSRTIGDCDNCGQRAPLDVIQMINDDQVVMRAQVCQCMHHATESGPSALNLLYRKGQIMEKN
jgi:hypothetical protein